MYFNLCKVIFGILLELCIDMCKKSRSIVQNWFDYDLDLLQNCLTFLFMIKLVISDSNHKLTKVEIFCFDLT